MHTGINDHGAIAGFYVNLTTNLGHGYLLRNGVRTPIDFPGALSTVAYDINNDGRVVGIYLAKDGSFHGFLWHKGKFTSIEIPGAVNGTFPFGINSVGDIVGEYDDATTAHGFLLHWRDYEDKDSDNDDGN
jgi:probable HAF family extracellular repeat protein